MPDTIRQYRLKLANGTFTRWADAIDWQPAEKDAEIREMVDSKYLRQLVAAVNYRAAVVATSDDYNKIKFANDRVWEAIDAAQKVLP